MSVRLEARRPARQAAGSKSSGHRCGMRRRRAQDRRVPTPDLPDGRSCSPAARRPVPLTAVPRASTCARACCCAGPAGWGEFAPFCRVRRRRVRARWLAAARRGGWRRLAGAAPRRGAGQRDRPGGRPRGGRAARARAPAAAAPRRSRSPSRARPTGRRRGPGRGGPRRARARRAGPGRRQRRLGRRDRGRTRWRALAARGAGWSTSSSRARPWTSWPRVRRRGRRPGRGRRVDPQGRATRCGSRGREARRHRSCSRSRRSAGSRPACGSPSRCGLPVVVSSARSTPRSGSPPGVALAAALPELPYACGLGTGRLLAGDVVRRRPLLPGRRVRCRCGRPGPGRRTLLARAGGADPTATDVVGPARGWPSAYGEHGRAVNPSTALARVARRRAGPARRARGGARARARGQRPLAFALHDADAAGRLRLHVRIDERSAGFLALGPGQGVAGGRSPVVTTSGTAAANLHPAVLEARARRRPAASC